MWRACTRLRSSLISRKVLLRFVATFAFSVISRMKCDCSSASAGSAACWLANDAVTPGATNWMRSDIHPSCSCFTTFLIVEMWKGTSRPFTGTSTVSALPSTCVWLSLSTPLVVAVGYAFGSRYASAVSRAPDVPAVGSPCSWSRLSASVRIWSSSSSWCAARCSFVSACLLTPCPAFRVRDSLISTLPIRPPLDDEAPPASSSPSSSLSW